VVVTNQWTREQTLLLLYLYREHKANFSRSHQKKKVTWRTVAEEMSKRGTGIQ